MSSYRRQRRPADRRGRQAHGRAAQDAPSLTALLCRNRLPPWSESSRFRPKGISVLPPAGDGTMHCAMDIIFDRAAIAAHRHRALKNGDHNAAFLLDIAATELAERLSVVERQFDRAVELHGATGTAAK